MGRSSELAVIDRLFRWGAAVGDDDSRLLERFRDGRDEAAFAALVDRHGPMVLGVCRRSLRDDRDVEDAFQATFLILARRAGTIRGSGGVGPWLHGVAHRVATRARADSARRFVREGVRLEVEPSADAAPEAECRELRSIVDDELRRLPGRFRDPVVLCHLEGLTHDQAADRLRLPVGTVRSRLARARAKLRDRLERRGLSAADAPSLLPLAEPLSPALLEATLRSSLASATAPASTLAAAGVVALADGVLQAMIVSKTKLAAVALGTMLTLGGASGYALQQGGGGAAGATSEDAPPRTVHDRASRENPDKTSVTQIREHLADLERKLDRKRYQHEFLSAEIQGMEESRERARKELRMREAEEAAAGSPAVETGAPSTAGDPATRPPATEQLSGPEQSLARDEEVLSKLEAERARLDADIEVARATVARTRRLLAEKDAKASVEAEGPDPFASQGEEQLQDARPTRGAATEATQKQVVERVQQTSGGFGGEVSAPATGSPVQTSQGTRQTPQEKELGGQGVSPGGFGGGVSRKGVDGFAPQGGRERYIVGPQIVIAPSANGRVLTGYSLKLGRAKSLRIAPDDSDLQVVPSIAPGVAAVRIQGAKVEQVAAFSSTDGEWHPQSLREPTDDAIPQYGPGLVAYPIGRRVYAFSATANRWDVLELHGDLKAWASTYPTRLRNMMADPNAPLSFQNDSIMCQDEHKLHIFSGQAGTWTSIDIEAPEAAEKPNP